MLIENLYGFSGTIPPLFEFYTCCIEIKEDCESVKDIFEMIWSESPGTRVKVGIERAKRDLSEALVKFVNFRFLISLFTI